MKRFYLKPNRIVCHSLSVLHSPLLFTLSSLLFTLISLHSHAQRHELLSEQIQTLQVIAADRWMALPVIDLNSSDVVSIDFDDMTHEYHRYTYVVEHCESDWSVSTDLFETDYLEGFYNGLTIGSHEESLNMATLYTHYHLELPNSQCRLKMSGNYRVTVFDEDNGNEPVLKAYFMVADRKFGVGIDVKTNTDIDINHSHQQLDVTLQYNNVDIVDPDRQVKTIVMQNNRWTTARILPRPQYVNRDGLTWQHCRDLIYPATNEYRKFEYLDIHRNSMGVDHTDFDGHDYNVWLNTDAPRPNYVYDEDADGSFYIRNTDDYNNDTESEYFVCHFTYHTAQPFDGDVYLNGQWTNDWLLPKYRMEYDAANQMYHCAIRLKMGYYSYQYLLSHPDGMTEYLPAEGNYFETENRYACLVYYRPTGGRADLLYGYAEK